MTAILETEHDEEKRRLDFLLNEGLDLLAAFRLISDPAKRAEIVRLVREAAMLEGACLDLPVT